MACLLMRVMSTGEILPQIRRLVNAFSGEKSEKRKIFNTLRCRPVFRSGDDEGR